MKFKLGRYYQHTTGEKIKIVALADTYMWGRTMIAEKIGTIELRTVGSDETSTVNYTEISEKEAIEKEISKTPIIAPCICTICGYKWEAFFPDGLEYNPLGIECKKCLEETRIRNCNGRFIKEEETK